MAFNTSRGHLVLEESRNKVRTVAAGSRSVISVSGVGSVTRHFEIPRRLARAVVGGNGISISAWSVTFLAHHELSNASVLDSSFDIGGRQLTPVDASTVLPNWQFITFVV